jgi:hypothetical protein
LRRERRFLQNPILFLALLNYFDAPNALGKGRSNMLTSPGGDPSTWGIMLTAMEMVPIPPGISGLMIMLIEEELPFISM